MARPSMKMNLDSLLSLVNEHYSLNYVLKEEQRRLIQLILDGQSCLGILPTGYGKSLTYILPPLLADEVRLKHAQVSISGHMSAHNHVLNSLYKFKYCIFVQFWGKYHQTMAK